MASATKANGKVKYTPSTDRYLRISPARSSKLGLAQVKPLAWGEQLLVGHVGDWPEGWSQMEGITGTRARLIADDWEGAATSKWNPQARCE